MGDRTVNAPAAPLDSADDLASRPGFDQGFIGVATPLPGFLPPIADDVLVIGESPELKYEHFSVAMSFARRMARWVAWNIDGDRLLPEGSIGRDDERFRADRRVPRQRQILDSQYRKNKLDRGHIARRADLLWGDLEEARRANSDSFYFTNITPQMDGFNQSKLRGLWGLLENDLLSEVDDENRRVSVFGGPVLDADDRPYKDIQVPDEFWKLFVYQLDGRPRAKAFRLVQDLSELERIELPEWVTHEISIADLSRRTSLDFGVVGEWESAMDERAAPGPIRSLADVEW